MAKLEMILVPWKVCGPRSEYDLDHDILATTDNSKEQDDKCSLHAATLDFKPPSFF